jgi:hypothetical protein
MTIIFSLPDPQSMIGFFFLESCLPDIVFFLSMNQKPLIGCIESTERPNYLGGDPNATIYTYLTGFNEMGKLIQIR